MDWEKIAKNNFDLMISKMPLFHRGVAKLAASKQAEENALSRGAAVVEEEDVVGAFFSEVPTPFYSMMVRLLEHTGIDYKKYGFPK